MSPLSGKVLLVGNFYYRGKTVFLDHGGGMISTYSHLSEISVREGQLIKKNEVIGEVGQTGRVTGPHLHWQIALFSVPIDPELFLEQAF
jgi:murein DD-endopeptidase MepM/ murein hydrolase activator NlpD